MTAADTAAVKTLIASAGALSGHVFITRTPDGPPQSLPYVLVHPAEGNDEQTRVTGPRIRTNPEFTLHIVAASAEAVQIVVDLVKAKFVVAGFVVPPTISLRKNQWGYWRQPLPIQTDKDVTPWLTYAVVELGWASDPA